MVVGLTKIGKELHDEMVEMRKRGSTYKEIMDTCHVSKWQCMNYLKEIKMDGLWITKEWEKAEFEAKQILTSMGFEHILNLNDICNVAPYWDYYAEKNEEKWLIDVTLNTQKSLMEKQSRGVNGFNLGVLYKTDQEWKLIKIISEIIDTKTI